VEALDMRGIESTRNLYEKTTGTVRKWGSTENLNAQPPVEKVTPDWIYQLAKISNSKPVLSAIPLKPPQVISLKGIDKSVSVKYNDSSYLGHDEYIWKYVDDYEVYHVQLEGSRKLVYVLWHNIIDKNWYAAYAYSFSI
jgi:hypothetical protein